jgi:hypothetical protein
VQPSPHVVVEGRGPHGYPVLRCRACGDAIEASCNDCVLNFHAGHQHLARDVGLGDVIAGGIKRLLGIAPCAACEERKQALNRAVPRVYRRW